MPSSGPSSTEIVPSANKPIQEKKATVYAEVLKNFNSARERALPFKPATGFKLAYESLGLDTSGGKSVTMQKIWRLLQTLMGEDSTTQPNVSRRISLVISARRHLELGHEKYIIEAIQNHPARAALGGAVGNLQRIRAFLRIRLRDYGALDFDAADVRRQPPVDTTWQQGRMLKRAFSKLKLEHVVIGKRHFQQERNKNSDGLEEEDLLALLWDDDADEDDRLIQTEISDEDLERVIDRRDLIINPPLEDSEKFEYPLKGPGWEIVVPTATGGVLSNLNS